MANNPRIEVEVGAKTDNFIRNIDGVILSMNELEAESAKIKDLVNTKNDENEIKSLNAQLAKLKAGMQALKTTGVDPLAKATSNYNGVGIEFSRIIQDAPFGIIGVGNNITQLASSFQQLRASSTSTGAALKTALTSIISPANLLVLGISAVTTALTLWQMGAFDSKEETKSLADATREAKEELNDYRDSLDSVTQASIKGASSAENEINNYGLLRKQAENANIPLQKRLEAVNELQKKYPEYLGSLSQEQILTGDVGNSYSLLANSIIATAKARAFSDKISQNSLDLLTIENKEKEKEIELNNLRAKQGSASTFNASQSGVIGGDLFSEADKLAAQIRDKEKEINTEREKANNIIKENLGLEKEIVNQINLGATFTKDSITSTSEKTKLVEKQAIEYGKIGILTSQIKGLEDEKDNAKTQEEINLLTGKINILKEELRLIEAIAKRANTPVNTGIDTTGLNAGVPQANIQLPTNIAGVNFDAYVKKVAETKEALRAQANEVNGISDELVSAFSGLGNQIANSLNIGNDALKGFIGTLISSTPKIIQALFQQAAARKATALIENQANLQVATGAAIATGAKAAAGLGPVGLALLPVFIGGAVALISKAFGKSGGGSGGGGSVGQGVSGQSFAGGGVGGLGGGNRELTGEMVVRGNDLVYVFNQTQNKIAKG